MGDLASMAVTEYSNPTYEGATLVDSEVPRPSNRGNGAQANGSPKENLSAMLQEAAEADHSKGVLKPEPKPGVTVPEQAGASSGLERFIGELLTTEAMRVHFEALAARLDPNSTGYIKTRDLLNELQTPTQRASDKQSSWNTGMALESSLGGVEKKNSLSRKAPPADAMEAAHMPRSNLMAGGTVDYVDPSRKQLLRTSMLKSFELKKTVDGAVESMRALSKLVAVGILLVIVLVGILFAVNIASIEMTKETRVQQGRLMTAGSEGKMEDQPVATTPMYATLDADPVEVEAGRATKSELTLPYFMSIRDVEYTDHASMWMRTNVVAQMVVPCPVPSNDTRRIYCVFDEDMGESHLWLLEGVHDNFAALRKRDRSVVFMKIYDEELVYLARQHVDVPVRKLLFVTDLIDDAVDYVSNNVGAIASGVAVSVGIGAVCLLTAGLGCAAMALAGGALSASAGVAGGMAFDSPAAQEAYADPAIQDCIAQLQELQASLPDTCAASMTATVPVSEPALCGALVANPTITYTGEPCGGGNIRWTSMATNDASGNPVYTNSGALCAWNAADQAGNTPWLNLYTGSCGVAPTTVASLPTSCGQLQGSSGS